MSTQSLPTDKAERKACPIFSGCMAYFPEALAEVARVSKVGNDQHNPGQPLHWARDKSTDHADCIARHLIDAGTIDSDGMRHSAKVAWRALALLQTEMELARGYDAAAEAGKEAACNTQDLWKDCIPDPVETANEELRRAAIADVEAAADVGDPSGYDIPDPGAEYELDETFSAYESDDPRATKVVHPDNPATQPDGNVRRVHAGIDMAGPNGEYTAVTIVENGTPTEKDKADMRDRREVERFCGKLKAELQHARSIHGDFNSFHEAYSVILEEVDEFWDEVKLKAQNRSMSRIRSELVQTAAMCLKAYMLTMGK